MYLWITLATKKQQKELVKAYKQQQKRLKNKAKEKEMVQQEIAISNFEDRESGVILNDKTTTEKLKINSYWLPSLAPEPEEERIEKPKKYTECPEGKHPLQLKQLIPVNFSISSDDKNSNQENTEEEENVVNSKKNMNVPLVLNF